MHGNKRKYGICDTTLRDGEQMPGVVFGFDEKVELATKSADFGVDIIELMPAVSDSEKRLAKQLAHLQLGVEVAAATILKKEHIDIVLDCDIGIVTLFTPLSDIHLKYKLGISRKENLERSLDMVDYARAHGLRIIFAGEDSTRADTEYVVKFINELSKYIEYFMPCDTLGCLTPFDTYGLIEELNSRCLSPLCLHIHNDFGMATANTLAGLEAGAKMFSGTFGGIGERAGNAPIEEVCTALKFLNLADMDVKYEMLTDICRLVERYSRITLQNHKPVVGRNAFTHESGIHVDGVLKNPLTYENFDPGLVGQKRTFLFGKHTGKSIVRYLKEKYGIKRETDEMLEEIKSLSERIHRSLSEPEIVDLLGTHSPAGALANQILRPEGRSMTYKPACCGILSLKGTCLRHPRPEGRGILPVCNERNGSALYCT